jgi:hypothetical protein
MKEVTARETPTHTVARPHTSRAARESYAIDILVMNGEGKRT